VEQQDIDQAWQEKQKVLKSYLYQAETPPPVDQKAVKEDAARTFRTKILIGWIFSNLLLIVIFTNELSLKYLFPRTSTSVNPYLTFLFWSTTFLSLVRAIGSTVYIYQVRKEAKEDRAAQKQSPA